MHVRNGSSSGRNSFSVFVGTGSSAHDFGGAFIMVFLMSSAENTLKVSSVTVEADGSDD